MAHRAAQLQRRWDTVELPTVLGLSRHQSHNRQKRLQATHPQVRLTHGGTVLGQIVVTEQKWSACKSRSTGGLDRKSTRLNSSHHIISYAVLCLKTRTKRSN